MEIIKVFTTLLIYLLNFHVYIKKRNNTELSKIFTTLLIYSPFMNKLSKTRLKHGLLLNMSYNNNKSIRVKTILFNVFFLAQTQKGVHFTEILNEHLFLQQHVTVRNVLF